MQMNGRGGASSQRGKRPFVQPKLTCFGRLEEITMQTIGGECRMVGGSGWGAFLDSQGKEPGGQL